MALALSLLCVVAIDANQPARGGIIAYAMLGAYPLFALLKLRIAWTDWYLDYRLRLPGMVVDIAMFFAAIYMTVRPLSEFASPFTAFFAFLLLSAMFQGGSQRAARLAIILTVLYLVEGALMYLSGISLNEVQFARRLIFNLVLGMFILWLGIQRRRIQPDRLNIDFNLTFDALFDELVAFAMQQTGAIGGALIWLPEEEPWIYITRMGTLGSGTKRLGPEDIRFISAHDDIAVLFDIARSRALQLTNDYRLSLYQLPTESPLCRYLGINEGISTPVYSPVGKGAVLLTGIDGASPDHLELARQIGIEIGSAIERHTIIRMARSTEAARIRDALARDLHDSVVQSLAGANFRLEALLGKIRSGDDAETEVLKIQHDLRDEQSHVRSLIDRLRSGDRSGHPDNLAGQLHATIDELSRHWHIDIQTELAPDLPMAPGWLVHEIQQILREAVANAARHGTAKNIAFNASRDEGMLIMDIADDGLGFAPPPAPQRPRSISERVLALGGKLAIETAPGRTLISVCIPFGDQS